MKDCSELGIHMVSAYVLSTENWKRPEDEINSLMELIRTKGKDLAKELHRLNVKINFIGSTDNLSEDVIKIINEVTELTKNNTKYVANMVFNYGGRREITQAYPESRR